MSTTHGSDWTNHLDEWNAVDNGNGTVTFTKNVENPSGAHAVFATLSEGGRALVRRLIEGNVRWSGAHSAATTTTLTFDADISLEESAGTYLHGQPNR